MKAIKKAAEIIRQGGLVAFPTETVYGLGADARNQEACLNIYKAKGRSSHNPLIVHVSTLAQGMKLAEFNDDALKLADLWPGPLTIVLPQKKDANIADCVTAGLDTIAIRIPFHSTALELINVSGCAIAAPSANKSGSLSTTSAEHVKANFGTEIFTLGTKQNCSIGLESTIIDLSTNKPTILRHGFFTLEIFEKLLNKEIKVADKDSKIKAPGMLLKHYAPITNIRLEANFLQKDEIGLNFGNSTLDTSHSLNLSIKSDLLEAALNLYNFLHILDNFCIKNNIKTITIAPIPHIGIGIAINDRLKRAGS